MLLAAELVLFCLFVSFLAVFVIHFCKFIAGFCCDFRTCLLFFCGESLMTVSLLGLWLKLNLQKPAQVLFWLFKFLSFLLYFCSGIFGACMLSLATKNVI